MTGRASRPRTPRRRGWPPSTRAWRNRRPRTATRADPGAPGGGGGAPVAGGWGARSAEASAPRRGVIPCWVGRERAAAAAGVPRQPGDTSTDLVTRLLSGRALTPEVLAGFAGVYR